MSACAKHCYYCGSKCVSHREPAADVSDKEEGVMFEVAHHGVAAAQLRGPAVPLVVVADAAVANHGQDEGEDPLVVTGGKERDDEMLTLCRSSLKPCI